MRSCQTLNDMAWPTARSFRRGLIPHSVPRTENTKHKEESQHDNEDKMKPNNYVLPLVATFRSGDQWF
jgi:hypothetical protein